MTLKEFYASIGADYNIVFSRLMNNEAFILKYLNKFLEDPNFEKLTAAVTAGNMAEIEVCAHTLKGITSNLELTGLCEAATSMVAAVRSDQPERIAPLFEEAKKHYIEAVAGISQLT